MTPETPTRGGRAVRKPRYAGGADRLSHRCARRELHPPDGAGGSTGLLVEVADRPIAFRETASRASIATAGTALGRAPVPCPRRANFHRLTGGLKCYSPSQSSSWSVGSWGWSVRTPGWFIHVLLVIALYHRSLARHFGPQARLNPTFERRVLAPPLEEMTLIRSFKSPRRGHSRVRRHRHRRVERWGFSKALRRHGGDVPWPRFWRTRHAPPQRSVSWSVQAGSHLGQLDWRCERFALWVIAPFSVSSRSSMRWSRRAKAVPVRVDPGRARRCYGALGSSQGVALTPQRDIHDENTGTNDASRRVSVGSLSSAPEWRFCSLAAPWEDTRRKIGRHGTPSR